MAAFRGRHREVPYSTPLLDVVEGHLTPTVIPTTLPPGRVTPLISVSLKKSGQTVPYSGDRLVYTLVDESLASMDPTSRRFALEQMARDDSTNTSVPLLNHDIESIPDPKSGEFIKVKLGAILATDRYSRTFAVAKHKDLVIKYATNCEGEPGLTRISREYMFLEYLYERVGTVPKAHFLSAPTRLQAEITPKTHFRMAVRGRLRCIEMNAYANVRFLVMSPVEHDMRQVAASSSMDSNRRDLLKHGSRYIRIAMRNLQLIHRAGVIHGGIDETKVVRITTPRIYTYGFTGWESGMFASAVVGQPGLVREPLTVRDCHASPFEIEGFRSSYRDDAFRLVQVLAVMLNGEGFGRYCESLTPENLLRFKRDEFIFNYPGGKDIALGMGRRLEPFRVQYVMNALTRVLTLVRGVPGVDDTPPYAEIIAELTGISDIL